MFRTNWKYLVAILVVVAVVTMAAPQAQAFHGWRGCGWGGGCYSSGCWGGWGGACYGGGCCGSWGYSSYSCCKPCYTACYTSCCGPCYSCSYCSWDCCGSICTTSDTCSDCEPAGTTVTPAPEKNKPTPAPAKPAPKPAAKPASTQIETRENSGLLTIWVPAKAKVFINGMETKTTGSRRRYVSNGLQAGLTYKYVIRAEIVRNGKIAEETKTVNLAAGSSEGVAFGFNVSPLQQLAIAQ